MRMCWRTWLGLLVALASPLSAYARQPVAVDCPDKRLGERIEQILQRYPGQLNMDQVNFLVRRLMLLRGVRNVTAEVHGTELSVLRIVVHPVIEAIDYDIVDGSLLGRDLLGQVRIESDLPVRYSDALTTRVAERARQVLVAEGYREARAVPLVEADEGFRWRLRIRLVRGPRYKVASLQVVGDVPPPRKVRLVGRGWSDATIEEASEAWAQSLRQQGYLDAVVRIECTAVERAQARCVARIDPGPMTSISFLGHHTYGTADLLDVLALEPERRYGVAELRGLSRTLVDFYTEQGFYDAAVTVDIDEPSADLRSVRYYISEGARTRFVGVRVRGMPAEYAAEVSDVLEISARRLVVFFRGKERTVRAAARSEEAGRLEVWLQERGYLDARVEDQGLIIEDGRAWWDIGVDAGGRVYLGGVEVEGDAPGLSAALVQVRTGFVARPDEIEAALQQWLADVRSMGYIDAQARVTFQRVTAEELIVRIVADQGPLYRIADVAISGLLRTDERAVLGVLPMRPGDVADHDQLQNARRILIERRVFGRVDAAWQLRDAATGWITPLITVVERSAGEVEFGVLFTTEEGLGFDLRLAHNRIGGVFRSLQLIGSVLYQPQDYLTGAIFREAPWLTRWSLRYREPVPARFPVFGDLTGTLELNRNDRDIDWLIYNIAAGPTLEPLKNVNIGISYVYEWFQVLKVKRYPLLAAGVAATDQTDRLGGLRLTAIWDNLDNRFDPRNGIGAFQELQFIDRALGGEHRLLRYEANVRLLKQTRGRIGFWSSLRTGAITAWSSGVPRLRSKVFRLGGASSVRGYERNSVSPYTSEDARDGSAIVDDNGEPIAVETGGRWFVNGQGETRVLLSETFDLALFLDAATITGFDGQRVNAAGAGAGMLYHTPAGPIRLDVGRRLIDLPTDRGGNFRVHFYVLTTF